MDTSSLILGGILTLLCLSPFAYEIIRLRKRNQFIKQLTKNLTGAETARLKDVSQIKSIVLAWEPQKNKLLFYRKNESEQPLWLDLNQYKNVLLDLKRSGNSKNGSITEVVLELKGDGRQEHLCLYNSEIDATLGGEIQLGKAWQERLEKHLKTA